MDEWFGRISVDQEVVEILALDFDQTRVSKLHPGMTVQEAVGRYGSPTLKTWLERHYDGPVFRQVRKTGDLEAYVAKEYSMMVTEEPYPTYRVRVTTWPKRGTRISLIDAPPVPNEAVEEEDSDLDQDLLEVWGLDDFTPAGNSGRLKQLNFSPKRDGSAIGYPIFTSRLMAARLVEVVARDFHGENVGIFRQLFRDSIRRVKEDEIEEDALVMIDAIEAAHLGIPGDQVAAVGMLWGKFLEQIGVR